MRLRSEDDENAFVLRVVAVRVFYDGCTGSIHLHIGRPQESFSLTFPSPRRAPITRQRGYRYGTEAIDQHAGG